MLLSIWIYIKKKNNNNKWLMCALWLHTKPNFWWGKTKSIPTEFFLLSNAIQINEYKKIGKQKKKKIPKLKLSKIRAPSVAKSVFSLQFEFTFSKHSVCACIAPSLPVMHGKNFSIAVYLTTKCSNNPLRFSHFYHSLVDFPHFLL